MLNGFCIAGLPLRRPRDNTLVWKRQDERFALTVQSPEIGLPGGSTFIAGLPFGPKARLLAMWLATEFKDPNRRSDDRWIEIGKISDWLRAVGISPEWGPRGSVVATKDQFLRLAFAQFSMVFRRKDGFQPFKHETLIEAGVFHDNDLEKASAGKISDTKWPSGFLLSQTAFDRFAISLSRSRPLAYVRSPIMLWRSTFDAALLPAPAYRAKLRGNHYLAPTHGAVRKQGRASLSVQGYLHRFDQARPSRLSGGAGGAGRYGTPASPLRPRCARRAFFVLPRAGVLPPTGRRRASLGALKLASIA